MESLFLEDGKRVVTPLCTLKFLVRYKCLENIGFIDSGSDEEQWTNVERILETKFILGLHLNLSFSFLIHHVRVIIVVPSIMGLF